VYVDHNSKTTSTAPPLVISHGMLGSQSNWTSLAKQIHHTTGRRVITVDARNHGDSPHTKDMSYHTMALDLAEVINDIQLGEVCIVGHSMGGRTSMYAALTNLFPINSLVIVDISPINQDFDVTSNNEWNMEHYFHCLKAVNFDQSKNISQARKDADSQLATRIRDPGLRAWLLMNMKQNPETKEIGWRINLDAIHSSFKNSIAVFPDLCGNVFEGKTLFLGGSDSGYIPVVDHGDILDQFPNANFEYVHGAGHWVHSQKPKEFLEKLLKFI